MNEDLVKNRIYKWLNRRVTSSAVRRVSDLPLAIATDVGVVRKENQDRIAVFRLQYAPDKTFMAVVLCDGMGGMEAGAECASESIAMFLSSCIKNVHLPLKDRAFLAAHDANKAVYEKYKGSGGSTLSTVLYDSVEGLLGLNIGDSRIYGLEKPPFSSNHYAESKITQLTVDDTIAGQMSNVNGGLRRNNELLQFIGLGKDLEPHEVNISENNSLLILTSDGVHYLDEKVLQMTIQTANDPATSAKRLVEIAKWCGGRDNASIAIISTNDIASHGPTDLGVIYLWDAFGELQIFDPSRSFISRNSDKLRIEPQIDQKKNLVASDAPKEKKKRKSKSKKSEDNDIPDVKPQLKIDFDEGKDEKKDD